MQVNIYRFFSSNATDQCIIHVGLHVHFYCNYVGLVISKIKLKLYSHQPLELWTLNSKCPNHSVMFEAYCELLYLICFTAQQLLLTSLSIIAYMVLYVSRMKLKHA